MKHICNKLAIIGSANDLSLGWQEAITWTNEEMLLNGSLKIVSEILFENFGFTQNIHLKMQSANGDLLPASMC